VQVLQACAVQVIKQAPHTRERWKQAIMLRTVCRRAPHDDTGRALERLGGLSWSHATSDRRFKQALEAPSWTTLHPDTMCRLWRALGRAGALLAPLLF